MIYFKRLDLVTGLAFHNNFVVNVVTDFTSGSTKSTTSCVDQQVCIRG